MKNSFILLLALIFLTGCGVKGNLYLPDQSSETSKEKSENK